MKITPILVSFMLFAGFLCGTQMDEKYLVKFGEEGSPTTIVEYVSYACPHCLDLFRQHFDEIKRGFIDTGDVLWVFHPVPRDILTVQATHCLEKLNEEEKRIFFSTIFEEIESGEPELSAELLKKAMEILGKPIPRLTEKEYLMETEAFEDSYVFLKENQEINGLPFLSVNGQMMPTLVPDEKFVEALYQGSGM